MQPNYLLAFRKRLFNRGYRDIHISRYPEDDKLFWFVCAIEPLSKSRVSSICSVDFIINSFR